MSDKNSMSNEALAVKQGGDYHYEQPICYAPLVQLKNNNWVVPQHFLRYQHSIESVNEVIKNITFSDHFTLLAAQQDNQIYLQVAILGPDNYQSCKNKKLLFGRRWLVEPDLPTSELIQTAFLALKVAREHEVRELFQFRHQQGFSTPFNNHHDLPLIAQNSELVVAQKHQLESVGEYIKRFIFAGAPITLLQQQALADGQSVYTVKICCCECQLSEFNNTVVSFLAASENNNSFIQQLFNALLSVSNRYVNEHFKYLGIARFSENISAEKIGELSIALRSPAALRLCTKGKDNAKKLNVEVDKRRAPAGCSNEIGGFLAAHGIEQPENIALYSD